MAGIVHIFHAGRRGYRQRVHTERPKPLQQYTTEELYNRFRFGFDDINYIADLVRPQLQCRTLRSHALTVEEQVLIALRFYACGTFYQVIADSMGVHRTTVGEVVTAVSDALARLLDHFVTFPNDGQIAKVKQQFFLLGDMPNTIRVIDCTHIHIQAQMRYNNAHGRTRCVIESLNGVLKRRFACLNYLRVEPQRACCITLACIVLHNIAVHRRVPLSDIDDPPEPLTSADDLGPPMDFPLNERLSGGAMRDAIVHNYF